MNGEARFTPQKVKTTFAPLLRGEARDHGAPVTRPGAGMTVQRGHDVTRVVVLTCAGLYGTLGTTATDR